MNNKRKMKKKKKILKFKPSRIVLRSITFVIPMDLIMAGL
jgi:hypothetical protein